MWGKAGPSTYFDTRAIISSHEIRKEIKCLSLHSNQALLACGCANELKLVRIDPNCSLTELHSNLLQAIQSQSQITDLSWNALEQTKLAISYVTGELKCFTLNANQKQMGVDWVGEKISHQIHKIAWSVHDPHILAAGISEGSVKFYDLREGKAPTQTFRSRGAISSSCRDLKFNTIDSNIFASASDNGRLFVWDRRQTQKPLINCEAHKSKVLTIAWNPRSEWILASGSADKTVKIWDTGQCDLVEKADRSAADTEPLLLQTLHASAEVNRLAWNPASSPSSHLMTVSLPGNSGPESNGFVNIWDTQRPNIPICILKGHGSEACAVAEWIDCKRSSELQEYRVSRALAAAGGRSGKVRSSKKQGAVSEGRRRDLTKIAMPCVISASAGKDGTLLLQNPRFGYFPYNHVAPMVARISSQGHLAFQRADIRKMVEEKNTARTPSASSKQTTAVSTASSSDAQEEAAAGSGKGGSVEEGDERDRLVPNGRVFLGMADFQNLQEAERVRSRGGAEATVFDPALIHLLARTYAVPQVPYVPQPASEAAASDASSEVKTREREAQEQSSEGAPPEASPPKSAAFLALCYENAVRACRQNFEVATAAGLKCRASVWASLEALIPRVSAGEQVGEHLRSDELPFSLEIIAGLLNELLEGGDSQHFVLVCETLRCAGILSAVLAAADISAHRIRSIYLAYVELLTKLELFREANRIVKSSDDDQISSLSKKDVEMRIKCGRCKKDLKKKAPSAASATVWCENCRCCVSKCSLCDLPVTGLLQWCPVCSHGGHLSCLRKWFSRYNCCPTGCAHQCCFSFYEGDRQDFDERHVDIDVLLLKRREQLQFARTRQLESLFL